MFSANLALFTNCSSQQDAQTKAEQNENNIAQAGSNPEDESDVSALLKEDINLPQPWDSTEDNVPPGDA
jgi:hypothetical protein